MDTKATYYAITNSSDRQCIKKYECRNKYHEWESGLNEGRIMSNLIWFTKLDVLFSSSNRMHLVKNPVWIREVKLPDDIQPHEIYCQTIKIWNRIFYYYASQRVILSEKYPLYDINTYIHLGIPENYSLMSDSACICNQTDIAEQIIERYLSDEHLPKNDPSITLWMNLCWKSKHIELLTKILTKLVSTNANIQNHHVEFACKTGDLKLVKLLQSIREKQNEQQIKDEDANAFKLAYICDSGFNHACSSGLLGIAKYLISRDVYHKLNYLTTLLFCIGFANKLPNSDVINNWPDIEIIKLLFSKCDLTQKIDRSPKDFCTWFGVCKSIDRLFVEACKSGKHQWINLLIDNIDLVENRHTYASEDGLIAAFQTERLEIVNIIMNHYSFDPARTIERACSRSIMCPEVAITILNNDKIHNLDKQVDYTNAIQMACDNGYNDVVELFLSKIDAKYYDLNKLFLKAYELSKNKDAELFLAKGATLVVNGLSHAIRLKNEQLIRTIILVLHDRLLVGTDINNTFDLSC